jgi:FAD-linked sulfhydryl oxidase
VQGIQQQLQRLQPPHTQQQQKQQPMALSPQHGSTGAVVGISTAAAAPSAALTSTPPPAAAAAQRPHSSAPRQVTKEELGRATWTFLHTLAAQFPEHPSRQQQKDARTLMDVLTRIYPCADCASHFQEIVRCVGGWAGAGAEQQAGAGALRSTQTGLGSVLCACTCCRYV